MTHNLWGINFRDLVKMKYYGGKKFREIELKIIKIMVFLQKVLVFNRLCQFPNSKKEKKVV